LKTTSGSKRREADVCWRLRARLRARVAPELRARATTRGTGSAFKTSAKTTKRRDRAEVSARKSARSATAVQMAANESRSDVTDIAIVFTSFSSEKNGLKAEMISKSITVSFVELLRATRERIF
jgi:hypothetical protein